MKTWQKIPLQTILSSSECNDISEAEMRELLLSRNNFPIEIRLGLIEVMTEQYQGVQEYQKVKGNIQSLGQSNTYTITTGQQIVTGLGPWMILYKIATTIQLCEKWKSLIPECHFVPIFWMATEDHDWLEIAQIQFGEHQFKWDASASGAVGRMSAQSTAVAIEQWNLENTQHAFPEEILTFYKTSATLAEAVRKIANHYFGEYGLVVLDADSATLKNLVPHIWEQDAVDARLYHTSTRLNTQKGEIEIKECNLFSLSGGQRVRISNEEYPAIKNANVQDLSPNVALRIVYQESILPNLIYVGGPSEQRYWAQVTPCIRDWEEPVARFVLRERGWMLSERMVEKWLEKGLDDASFLWDEKALKQYFLSHWGELPLQSFQEKIQVLFEEQLAAIEQEDPTLVPGWEAEKKKTLQASIQMQQKIEKVRKRKDAEAMSFVERWILSVRPKGQLQERHDYWTIAHNKKAIPMKEWLDLIDSMDPTYKVWMY